MLRAGYIGKRGVRHQFEYFFVRDPLPTPTLEERLEKERLRRARRAQAARDRRAASRPATDFTPRVREHKPRPAPSATIKQSMARTFKTLTNQAVATAEAKSREPQPRPETIEEFLARGGGIDVLPHSFD